MQWLVPDFWERMAKRHQVLGLDLSLFEMTAILAGILLAFGVVFLLLRMWARYRNNEVYRSNLRETARRCLADLEPNEKRGVEQRKAGKSKQEPVAGAASAQRLAKGTSNSIQPSRSGNGSSELPRAKSMKL